MKITKILACAFVFTGLISCGNNYKQVSKLEKNIDSVSYAVGLNISSQMRKSFGEMDQDAFVQGLKDGLDSANFKLDPRTVQNVIRPYFQKKNQELAKEREAKIKKDAETRFADNKKAGEDFLAENKNKKGVITTASGFQYMVMKEGKGDLVKPTDRIRIHYHGTNIDGEVFDSTVEKKAPYESTANIFVTGFNEGLSLMKKGSKYKFFIPQELAYGYRQKGPKIKPYSALIFEVEILDILTK